MTLGKYLCVSVIYKSVKWGQYQHLLKDYCDLRAYSSPWNVVDIKIKSELVLVIVLVLLILSLLSKVHVVVFGLLYELRK